MVITKFVSRLILYCLLLGLMLPGLARAQAPSPSSSSDPLPTPAARTLFQQPRDGVPLLLRLRDTYEECLTYRAQGAVRVVIYEETEKSGGFLFQGETSAKRTKRYKLFATSFKRAPIEMRHEIVSMGTGRSFTSIEFWAAQRHAVDHFSSSNLPMSSQALAKAIRENDFLLVNYDPAPEWLLASVEELQPALPEHADWLTEHRRIPRDAWWVGEENLAGVDTDILAWRASNDINVAMWVTRDPLAIVKVMAEQRQGKEYVNVTSLIQPEFGVAITDDELALNRKRPPFFDIDPETVVFGGLELPDIPEKSTPRASAADFVENDLTTPRSTETPTPPEPTPAENEDNEPIAGAANAPKQSPALPGERVEEEAEDAKKQATHLTPEQMKSIVVIEGDQGVGTGFFCHIRGRDFIVTNQHVLTGHRQLRIRTVNGDPVQASEIYGAIGHDIALIAVENPPGTLKAASNVGEETEIGDQVIVPGNKLGGGVVTQVTGKVLGIGPDRVEIDAKFVPGNSGSPVINMDTGDVIAVATYVRKDPPQNFAEKAALSQELDNDGAIVRWFGYRIDSVEQWQQISWYKWRRQHELVKKFNEDNVAIYNYIAEKPAFYNNDDMRELYDDYLKAINDTKQNDRYFERETKLFIQRIINFAKRDLDDARKTKFYDYFKTTASPEDNIEQNIEYRQILIEHLNKIHDSNWREIYRRVRS